MKRFVILLITMVFLKSMTFAQLNVTGIITDKDKVPLEGVTIAEKGSTNGTYTNSQGNYSIVLRKLNTSIPTLPNCQNARWIIGARLAVV